MMDTRSAYPSQQTVTLRLGQPRQLQGEDDAAIKVRELTRYGLFERTDPAKLDRSGSNGRQATTYGISTALQSKRSISSTGILARKRLELKAAAAQEKARIQIELVKLRLQADIAALDEKYSLPKEQTVSQNRNKRRSSTHDNRREQQTQLVPQYGTHLDELCPPIGLRGGTHGALQAANSANGQAYVDNSSCANKLSTSYTSGDLPKCLGNHTESLSSGKYSNKVSHLTLKVTSAYTDLVHDENTQLKYIKYVTPVTSMLLSALMYKSSEEAITCSNTRGTAKRQVRTLQVTLNKPTSVRTSRNIIDCNSTHLIREPKVTETMCASLVDLRTAVSFKFAIATASARKGAICKKEIDMICASADSNALYDKKTKRSKLLDRFHRARLPRNEMPAPAPVRVNGTNDAPSALDMKTATRDASLGRGHTGSSMLYFFEVIIKNTKFRYVTYWRWSNYGRPRAGGGFVLADGRQK